MRIPVEALALFLNDSNKAGNEGKKPEPVDSAERPGDALKYTLRKRQQRFAGSYNSAALVKERVPAPLRRKSDANSAATERRHGERRKQNLPVLLDTRLIRNRRHSDTAETIRCTI